MKEIIREILADRGWITARELIEITGEPWSTVRNSLYRMYKAREVTRDRTRKGGFMYRMAEEKKDNV